MAKIITTTTTIAYLLIAVAAAPPPPKAPSPSEPAPTPMAPPPQLDCFFYLGDVDDCYNFIINGSELRKPAGKCCPELTNLIGTHPICLCELLFNSSQFDIPIDMNKVFKLPSLCNITTLHVNSCTALGVPVAIPGLSPGE
ncbi:hypothetical protein C2S52_002164 [Perilla frutescens var. hirtella]|nr:hypothetical protein C2S52_002164 [Perilla frutescens var. hirtella]